MKKTRLISTLIASSCITSLFATSVLTACGKSQIIGVESITIDPTQLTLYDGNSKEITVTVKPENATNKNLVWTSTDSNIAYFSNGKVYAKNIGTATITATSQQNSKVSATCTITVESMPSYTVTFLSDSGYYNKQQIREGEKVVKPVDPKMNNCTFAGWYDNEAKTGDAFNFDTPITQELTLWPKFENIPVTSVSLDIASATLLPNGKIQLNAKIEPKNATVKGVTWSIESGDDVASVDQNGLVTAIQEGNATVKATSNSDQTKFGTCDITVINSIVIAEAISVASDEGKTEITGGETLGFTATIQPSDVSTNKVNWTIEDPNNTGATLEATSDLTARLTSTVKGGTVKVKALTIDGSNLSAEISITIKKSGYKINWHKSPVKDDKTLLDLAKTCDVIIFGKREKYETEINAGMQPKSSFTPLIELNAAKGGTADIKAYYGSINPNENRLYVVSDEPIIFKFEDKPTGLIGIFQDLTNTSEIILENVFIDTWDFERMFMNDNRLTKLVFPSLDTSSSSNMREMFKGCSSLKKLDLSSFNTSNVMYMDSMFEGCSSLESIYVSSNFITSNVSYCDKMFENCVKLKGCVGTGYNEEKIDKEYARIDKTDSPGYFSDCKNVKIKWNTDNVGETGKSLYTLAKDANVNHIIFDKKYKYSGQSFEGFNQYQVAKDSADDITAYIKNDDTMYVLSNDVIYFEDSDKLENQGLFEGLNNLNNLQLYQVDTPLLTSMDSMFKNLSNLTNLDVSIFNTKNVTNMKSMFEGCSKLETIDLSSFETFNLKNTTSMFKGCSNVHTIFASFNFVTDDVVESDEMFANIPSDKGLNGLIGGDGSLMDASKTNKEYARVDYSVHDKAQYKGYFTYKYRITLLTENQHAKNYRPIVIEPNGKYQIYFYKNWKSPQDPEFLSNDTNTSQNGVPNPSEYISQIFYTILDIPSGVQFSWNNNISNIHATLEWDSNISSIHATSNSESYDERYFEQTKSNEISSLYPRRISFGCNSHFNFDFYFITNNNCPTFYCNLKANAIYGDSI